MIRLTKRQRAEEVIRRLEPLYGHLTTGLRFETPLELLVATILSAQCTDERVNLVTPALFERYRTAEDYAHADPSQLEEMVHSCGFFRNKTKSIQGAARGICERFEGSVPDTMKDLLTLPGVARKTANVVLAHSFHKNEGIAVDTHVQRLSGRLRLSVETDPVRVETDLMKLVPRERWGELSDLLIWHGRRVCGARTPQCGACALADVCPSAFRAGTASQARHLKAARA
ncbi:MAG TPA: endonuclease III [Chloroflexota bacterium]